MATGCNALVLLTDGSKLVNCGEYCVYVTGFVISRRSQCTLLRRPFYATTVVFGVGLIVELCDVVTCRIDSAVLQGPRRPDTVALAETAHDARTACTVDCDAAHDGSDNPHVASSPQL